MFKNNVIKIFLLISFYSLSSYSKEIITIGTIDTEPKEKIYKFQAIADYLQEKFNEKNIHFDVEIPKDINNAINLINNNKLDIFVDSIYSTIEVQKKSDISILAKRWKKGIEDYRSVVFVKKNSNLNNLADLKGKTIAFEDEFSTSGYFIPKKVMELQGLKVSQDGKKDSINYDYSRSEENTFAWVIYSKVVAGVTDDKTFQSYDNNMFKIIYKSGLIPRHLVSFSNKINPQLRDEILDILYSMDTNDKGKESLKVFSKTKKFTPLTSKDIELIKGYK